MVLAIEHVIRDLISGAHPLVQAAVITACLLALGWFWRRSAVHAAQRVSCEHDLRSARSDVKRLNAGLLREQEFIRSLWDKLGSALQAPGADAAPLKELEASLQEAHERLSAAAGENQEYLDRVTVAKDQGSRVWTKPALPETVPYEASRPDTRTTRYVSLLNLKGGVGKTTLAANVAASLATGVAGAPLRVLVVDLDHQATLTGLCVTPGDWSRQREAELCSDRILQEDLDDDARRRLLPQLQVPFRGLADNARVIAARGDLEDADTRALIEFVFDETDVRFRTRALLHSRWIQERYDLVIFDCPPRLTASCFGALLCTDYVFVPVAVTQHDLDALPRICKKVREWTEGLPSSLRPELGGVILNRVHRGDSASTLPQTDAPTLDAVRQHLVGKLGLSSNVILDPIVPERRQIARVEASGRTVGATPEGHALFGPVAIEIVKRIGLET